MLNALRSTKRSTIKRSKDAREEESRNARPREREPIRARRGDARGRETKP